MFVALAFPVPSFQQSKGTECFPEVRPLLEDMGPCSVFRLTKPQITTALPASRAVVWLGPARVACFA